MMHRCTNPEYFAYPNYGARGITVDERWRTLENFIEDMGVPPSGASLERVDNNGPYTKSNCVWATRKQQGRNRRSNALVDFDGSVITLIELAERTGISYGALKMRYRAGDRGDRLARPVQRR